MGSIVSTWLFFRERAARKTAVEEKQRADERAAVVQTVSDFLTSNLLGASSENNFFENIFKPKEGESLLQGLERAVTNIGDKFKGQPLIEAKLRQAIGDAYSSLDVKQPSLAVPQYERALALRRTFAGTNDESTLHSMRLLAITLKDAGRLAEAIALNAEALRLMRAKYGSESDECMIYIYLLADTYQKDGQTLEAIPLYRELVAIARKDEKTPALELSYRTKLAALYEKQSQFDQAEELLRESVARMEGRKGKNGSQLAIALKELATFLLRQQKHPDAELALRRCLRIQEEEQPDRWGTWQTQSLLGASLLGQKRFSDAEPFLLKGYAGLKDHEEEIPRDRKDNIQKALERLVELYTLWSKPEKAAEWRILLETFNQSQALEASRDQKQ